MFVDVDVPGGPQNDCDVTLMTSSTEETSVGHVTGEGVVSDVSTEAQTLLTGCIDDVTSLRVPTSRNIKVFVCSTGTGYRLICISHGSGVTRVGVTRGVTLFFLEKTDDLFSHRLWKVMTFFSCPTYCDDVDPVLFINLATKN